MRDDPYPARFYGRLMDEPFSTSMAATLPQHDHAYSTLQLLPQPLPRLLLLLLTLYLCCAIFLIFTVTSYAAPLSSTPGCIETATLAVR
ncbi:MAG: hypothetical protein IT328_08775 [Caldilineaceae bacterium]|nr:hypothetical protein [Caldilineaceae bacterium]